MGGGANRSSGAFLGKIPVVDDDLLTNGEAGASAAGAGVSSAVGRPSEVLRTREKEAVSLLAKAPKGAAFAKAATPATFILD